MTEGLTKQDVEELAARCYRSPVEFCRIFLPDWFPSKMPWVHRGILALLKNKTDFLLDFGPESWRDGPAEWTPKDLEKILTNFIEEGSGKPIFKIERDELDQIYISINVKSSIGIIMPRGSSKTTLVNASNLQDILFQDEDFLLYASESGPHAERQLGTIKFEMDDNGGEADPNNPLLTLVFGAHKPGRQSPLKWTENYIETLKGVMVGAVGRGGQVRGFGKRAKRPGLIVFDDIEDEESVKTDEQRKKASSWFFNAARPAKRKGGRDIIMGTLLHTAALLNKVIKSREFTTVRFGAIDRQGDALMDWYLTLEEIEAKKLAAAEVGELSGFYLEYMSVYKDDQARMFPESKIVYQHKGIELFVGMAEVCDPAISDKRRADECAFAVVGIERTGHKHVLDSYGEKGMDPFDIIEKFFELHFQWLAHLPVEMQKHGIEAVAFQQALIPMVRQAQVVKSRSHGTRAYFEVLPIFHGQIGKVTRIKGILKPLIWGGQLSFDHEWPELHNQLIDFPSAEHDDRPDVVAMACAMLDPYVMLNLGEEALEEQGIVIPEAFEQLPSLGEWRAAP